LDGRKTAEIHEMDEFERTLFSDNYLAALRSAPRHASYEVASKDYALATDVLVTVMYDVTKQARIRDEWESVTAFEQPGPSPQAFRQTKKTALEISLTIDLQGIFFECNLRHGYMLPYVDDRFWRPFVRLVLD
jgi:hypothetical protein